MYIDQYNISNVYKMTFNFIYLGNVQYYFNFNEYILYFLVVLYNKYYMESLGYRLFKILL